MREMKPKTAVVLGSAIVMLTALVLTVALWHAYGTVNANAQEIPISSLQSTINLSNSGFTPTQLAIKAGTTVTWVNQTSSDQVVAAGPYPTHASLPQFNSGSLKPQQAYSFTFSRPGTWQYQDDTNPLLNGTIVVQP